MDKLYNLRQVSELLGVSHRTVQRMAVDGRIKAHRYPGVRRVFVPAAEVQRLLGTIDVPDHVPAEDQE